MKALTACEDFRLFHVRVRSMCLPVSIGVHEVLAPRTVPGRLPDRESLNDEGFVPRAAIEVPARGRLGGVGSLRGCVGLRRGSPQRGPRNGCIQLSDSRRSRARMSDSRPRSSRLAQRQPARREMQGPDWTGHAAEVLVSSDSNDR